MPLANRRSAIVLVTGMAMVFLTIGIRQSMGLFLEPVTDESLSERDAALALSLVGSFNVGGSLASAR